MTYLYPCADILVVRMSTKVAAQWVYIELRNIVID